MRDRLHSLKKERDDLKEELWILEDAKDIDTDEVVQALSICFNLKEQYESMDADKQRELLLLCFREITAHRKKKGKGRRKKSDFNGFLHHTIGTLNSATCVHKISDLEMIPVKIRITL